MNPTKRRLTSDEVFQRAEEAQLAVLAGLASARRWQKGEIAFQGGTSLHLIYGSPRFSEDLDFITSVSHGIDRWAKHASDRARLTLGVGLDWEWRLKDRDEGRDESAKRNPRTFTLTMQAPDWMQAVRVKLEFWVAPEMACQGYPTSLAMARGAFGAKTQALIDTATIETIAVDKVWAVMGRDRNKARDWFDLWWLSQTQGLDVQRLSTALAEQGPIREQIYPNGPKMNEATARLSERLEQAQADRQVLSADIARWLLKEPHLAARSDEITDGALKLVGQLRDHLVAERARTAVADLVAQGKPAKP